MTTTIPTHDDNSFKLFEAHVSELPSPCSLYLSGKSAMTLATRKSTRSTKVTKMHSPKACEARGSKENKRTSRTRCDAFPIMRFSTERHSVTMCYRGCAATRDGSSKKRSIEPSAIRRKRSGGDDYFLDVNHLPSAATETQKTMTTTSVKNSFEGHVKQNEICLSHSFVELKDSGDNGEKNEQKKQQNEEMEFVSEHSGLDSSVEVFAMMRLPSTGSAEDIATSSTDLKSVAATTTSMETINNHTTHQTKNSLDVSSSTGATNKEKGDVSNGNATSATTFTTNGSTGCSEGEGVTHKRSSSTSTSVVMTNSRHDKTMPSKIVGSGNDACVGAKNDSAVSVYFLLIKTRLLVKKPNGQQKRHAGKVDKFKDKEGESDEVKNGSENDDDEKNDLPPLETKEVLSNNKIITMVPGRTERLKLVTTTDIIPLEFRPTLVHVSELHVTSSSFSLPSHANPDECTKAIGIFVAGADDNKLRMYVSTKNKIINAQIGVAGTVGNGHSDARVSAGDHESQRPPYFLPMSFSGAIDSRSAMSSTWNDTDHNHKSHQCIVDPLTFPTTIMALDACITDECTLSSFNENIAKSFEQSTFMKINRLAVACYDGTIRILSYQLALTGLESNLQNQGESSGCGGNKSNEDEATSQYHTHDFHLHSFSRSIPLTYSMQPFQLRASNFVVDGPIVSLHFGKTNTKPTATVGTYADIFNGGHERLPLPRQSIQYSNVFLMAGSLCGFACIFYEMPSQPKPLSSSHSNNQIGRSPPYFDGPIAIIDGLYDARREGYEDSVTSVHACGHDSSEMMVAVGTQGGRILLFRPACNNVLISSFPPTTSILMSSLKKLHRYQIAWEYHLPYPIHGIAYADADGDGIPELFICTRRSFHVFKKVPYSCQLMNCFSVIRLLETNLNKLLND